MLISSDHPNRGHFWIGVTTALLGMGLAGGATQIGGSAGYGGAGPAFLPWVVAFTLMGLGVVLALSSHRQRSEAVIPAPDDAPRWVAVAWVSVGLLLNAILIVALGFVLSCALLFALAARGFRVGADERPSLATGLRDLLIGVVISAPVYWMFTKVLGLTLPALLGPNAWI